MGNTIILKKKKNEYSDYLVHHGIKGQKWGVRRFETKSGHLTSAGKKRYDDSGDGQKTSAAGKKKSSKAATYAKIGAAVVATGLAAYGAYKLSKYVKSEAGKKSFREGKYYAENMFYKPMSQMLDKYYKTGNKADLDESKAFNTAYKKTLGNVDARTKKVSSNTLDAIKYLRHPENYDLEYISPSKLMEESLPFTEWAEIKRQEIKDLENRRKK